MTRACWTASICAASTSSVGSTADSKPCSDGRAVRLQVPNTTIKRCQVPPTFLAYSKSRSRAAHQRVRLGAVVGGLGSGHPVASAIVVSPSSILGTGRTHIRPAGLAAPPSPTRPSCQRSDGQEASGFGPALTARRGTRMTFKTDCSQRAVVAVGRIHGHAKRSTTPAATRCIFVVSLARNWRSALPGTSRSIRGHPALRTSGALVARTHAAKPLTRVSPRTTSDMVCA